MTYKNIQLSLWTKKWDEFNDRAYWSHCLTGENTLDAPTITSVQKSGWTHPELRSLQGKQSCGPNNNPTHIYEKIDCRNEWREGRLEKEALEAAKKVLERRRRNLLLLNNTS